MALAVVCVVGYLLFGAITARLVFNADMMQDGSLPLLWCFLWPLMAACKGLLWIARAV